MEDPDIDADGFDAQDVAETFDETHNIDEMGAPDETRSFEPDLFDDVYDSTARLGDSEEDDEASLDAADIDPDDIDAEEDDDEDLAVRLDADTDDDAELADEADQAEQRDGPVLASPAGDVEVEYVTSIDDRGGGHDRLSRRYESSGELSGDDLDELGYSMKDKAMGGNGGEIGSGAAAEDVADTSHPRQEDLLDEGIEESFPASDPGFGKAYHLTPPERLTGRPAAAVSRQKGGAMRRRTMIMGMSVMAASGGSAAEADDGVRAQVANLQALRKAAVDAGDTQALGKLLSDDYLHIHTNALVTDKAQTVAGFVAHPRTIALGPQTIRVWGDTAVAIGDQVSTLTNAAEAGVLIRVRATEVLHRRNGRWLFVSYASVKLPDVAAS